MQTALIIEGLLVWREKNGVVKGVVMSEIQGFQYSGGELLLQTKDGGCEKAFNPEVINLISDLYGFAHLIP